MPSLTKRKHDHHHKRQSELKYSAYKVIMLTILFFIVMLSVSMLNVFILSVVAPLEEPKPFSWLFCMFCYNTGQTNKTFYDRSSFVNKLACLTLSTISNLVRNLRALEEPTRVEHLTLPHFIAFQFHHQLFLTAYPAKAL
jgi:hypothetical protein